MPVGLGSRLLDVCDQLAPRSKSRMYTIVILTVDYHYCQVKHHAEYHPRAEVDFATMTSFEVNFCRSRLVPLSEMVVLPKDFLCAHCRDLPSEQPPLSIDGVKDHLKEK